MTTYPHFDSVLKRFAAGLAGFALAAVAALGVSGVVLAAEPPLERDFFGIVVSVGDASLTVATEQGTVEVPASEETEVRVPLIEDAGLADLLAGDRVAVSMEEEDGVLTADKVYVIPSKTLFRHVPGEVIEVSDTQLTLLPPAANAVPVTFSLGPDTKINFHGGTSELTTGSFVVVAAGRDAVTGELLSEASEVHVVQREPLVPDPESVPATADIAEFSGVLESLDAAGNWLVNGTTVTVDANTEIEGAVSIGQLVEVKADVQADGSLLALEIEAKTDEQVEAWTRLRGVFEGQDDQGRWLVSGTPVNVDERTDADGLPYVGQPVDVKAIVLEDGSLLAREIENKHGKRDGTRPDSTEEDEVELEGTLQGIAEDGAWTVNGTTVLVGPETRMHGTPAVGGRVEVEAIRQADGTLLATEVKGKGRRGHGGGTNAEFTGAIDAIGESSLTVRGIVVALSPLTEVEGELVVGARVKVEAVLTAEGTFWAREVEVKEADDDDEDREEVEIEGTIDQVNEDGSLVVNGITVVFSALSETKGRLTVGAAVKVEGVLQADGTVLAREVKGEGRRASLSGTEAKAKGAVEEVQRDADGKLTGIVVNGMAISVGPLTKVEGTIEAGATVEVKGVFSDGSFLAAKIEAEDADGDDEDDADEDDADEEEADDIEVEGAIEALQTGADGQVTGIVVHGVELIVDASTEIEGTIGVGTVVEVKAVPSAGGLVAVKIEAEDGEEDEEDEEEDAEKFKVKGVVESVGRDGQDRIVSLVVDGQTILVDPLTEIEGTLDTGVTVRVEGVVQDGVRTATEITQDGDQPDEDGGGGPDDEEEEDEAEDGEEDNSSSGSGGY